MQRKQEESFTAFVRDSGDALLRYARLLFADAGAAEDAVQTALLRVSRQWHRDLAAPDAYTRTVLLNLARDGGRRRHLVAVPSAASPATVEPDVAEAYAAAERLDELLGPLPPQQRLTVVLRVVDGLSEAETAALLRCSVGTVKSNLARGLSRLRAGTATRTSAERTAP